MTLKRVQKSDNTVIEVCTDALDVGITAVYEILHSGPKVGIHHFIRNLPYFRESNSIE